MITNVTYGNLTEGSGIGIIGFKIQIDNQIFPPDQVGEVMETLISFKGLKNRVAEINGFFAPVLNEQMLTLVMSLKNNGFHIQVNAAGDQYYPWFSMIDRLVIHINNCKIWPTFKCEDFVFHPVGDNSLKEPDVPKVDGVILYIYPGSISTQQMLRFLSKAVNYWRIYPITDFITEVTIFDFKNKPEELNGTSD